ncbi:MAG TPA: rhodanese-like domain-containing protein [Anaerolineales bacterium]
MPDRRDPRSILPLVLAVAGVLLILGAVLWVLNPFGLPQAASATNPGSTTPFPEIKRVGLADARAAYETKSAVFVDVRGDPYYSEGHIPGALSIPLNDITRRLNELSPKDWIIPYCT